MLHFWLSSAGLFLQRAIFGLLICDFSLNLRSNALLSAARPDNFQADKSASDPTNGLPTRAPSKDTIAVVFICLVCLVLPLLFVAGCVLHSTAKPLARIVARCLACLVLLGKRAKSGFVSASGDLRAQSSPQSPLLPATGSAAPDFRVGQE